MSGKVPEGVYKIEAQVEPAPQGLELEPNDTFGQATPIEDWRVGFLAPAGDIDLYRLKVTAPSLLHAELSGIEGVDTELTLVDAPAGPNSAPLRMLIGSPACGVSARAWQNGRLAEDGSGSAKSRQGESVVPHAAVVALE